MSMRYQRGFTLIEMMVVVAIIGVVAAVTFGMSSKPYTANPRAISEQIVGTMNLAKLRSVSTRRWHRVELTGPSASTPNSVVLWQWSQTGMAVPSGTCVAGPPVTNCWQVVQKMELPKNVNVYHAATTIYTSTGTSVTQNAALDFNVDFRPDGSSTGGTAFVADTSGTKKWRVLVRLATGSSYARESW